MTLLGQKKYNIDDDISSIIEKVNIQALLVSPTRLSKFRENYVFQEMLIKAGVKLYVAQVAKETSFTNEKFTDDNFA